MSKGFLERLIDIGVAGTALTNSTAQTSLFLGNTGEQGTLPAKYFDRIGKALSFRAYGRISTVVTTPGTLTLTLRFGSIDVWTSGAMTLNVVAKTNVGWILDVPDLTCRAIGSSTSANLIGGGTFTSEAVIASVAPTAGGELVHVLPYNAAPAVGSGFDSSAAQLVDMMGTWSVQSASNSIRLEGFTLDVWS